MPRRSREPASHSRHDCTLRCLGLACLLVVLGATWAPTAAGVVVSAPAARAARAQHPKDGPDVDLRLAIADTVVRLHLTMNLAFIDAFVDVPREDPSALHPVEHPGLAAALRARLAEVVDLHIDGVAVPAVFGDFTVSDDALQLLPLFPTFGARALIQITQTLEYPALQPPDSVELSWSAYPPDVTLALAAGLPESEAPPLEIAGRLLVGPRDDPLPLSAAAPTFAWTRDGAAIAPTWLDVPAPSRAPPPGLPAPAIACALVGLGVFGLRRPRALRPRLLLGGLALVAGVALWPATFARISLGDAHDPALPDAARARAVFEPLHANIYRAFDYTTPSDVYDALAASVGGELLPDLYDRVYRSLVMQDHGGAVARVQAVRPLATELEASTREPESGRPVFVVRARWQVDGVVRHWGHSHARTHEYAARYTVRADDAGWRLVSDEVLEERQLSATPLDPGAPDEPVWELAPGEEL